MLADECPNTQCYGIPLVRPPKSGAEKDPRKVPRDTHIFLYAKLTQGVFRRNASSAIPCILIKSTALAFSG